MDRDRNELYLRIGQERLQSQEGLNAEYGTKAFGIFSLAVAILAAGALVLRYGDASDSGCLYVAILAIASTAALFMLATALLTIRVMTTRKWSRGPQIDDLEEFLPDYEFDKLLRWTGDRFRNSVNDNRAVLESKELPLNASMYTLSLQALLVIVLSILSLAA